MLHTPILRRDSYIANTFKVRQLAGLLIYLAARYVAQLSVVDNFSFTVVLKDY